MGKVPRLPSPVADLVDARSRHAGSLGEFYSGDAELQSLADQAAQLDVGGVECVSAGRLPLRQNFRGRECKGGATFSPRKMRLLHPCPSLQSCGDRTMSGVAQTAIPADVERPTSASVQETAKVRK